MSCANHQLDSTQGTKRPAEEPASGIQKKAKIESNVFVKKISTSCF